MTCKLSVNQRIAIHLSVSVVMFILNIGMILFVAAAYGDHFGTKDFGGDVFGGLFLGFFTNAMVNMAVAGIIGEMS